MPLPKPKAGESESDYMSRCMSDATVRSEYPRREQRVAVCLSKFGDKPKEQIMGQALEQEQPDGLEFEECKFHVPFDIKAYHDKDKEEEGVFMGYGSVFNNKD